jgi:hypothetical protein
MLDLFRWLVDNKKWRIFVDFFAYQRCVRDTGVSYNGEFINWLFYKPDRFCWLVSQMTGDKGGIK